ncbi:MAG: DinB family protein [Bacteroidota bacterium]
MRDQITKTYKAYCNQVHQLLSELESVPDALLNQNPVKGGWTAIQTMHHLIMSEEQSLVYVRKKMSFNPVFERAGIGSYMRSFALWLMLTSPIKFRAPKFIAEAYLPANESLANTRKRWEAIQQEWLHFFAELPTELLPKTVYKHPRAGRQTFRQMVWFFRWHFKRHRKQIMRAIGK